MVLAVTIEQDNTITLHESACSSANYHTTYKQIVLPVLPPAVVPEEIGLSRLFAETIRVELRFMVPIFKTTVSRSKGITAPHWELNMTCSLID